MQNFVNGSSGDDLDELIEDAKKIKKALETVALPRGSGMTDYADGMPEVVTSCRFQHSDDFRR